MKTIFTVNNRLFPNWTCRICRKNVFCHFHSQRVLNIVFCNTTDSVDHGKFNYAKLEWLLNTQALVKLCHDWFRHIYSQWVHFLFFIFHFFPNINLKSMHHVGCKPTESCSAEFKNTSTILTPIEVLFVCYCITLREYLYPICCSYCQLILFSLQQNHNKFRNWNTFLVK